MFKDESNAFKDDSTLSISGVVTSVNSSTSITFVFFMKPWRFLLQNSIYFEPF